MFVPIPILMAPASLSPSLTELGRDQSAWYVQTFLLSSLIFYSSARLIRFVGFSDEPELFIAVRGEEAVSSVSGMRTGDYP